MRETSSDPQAEGLLGWFGEPWVLEKMHRHSDVELNLVAQGELRYLMGGAVQAIRAGEVATFWAVTPHRIVDCAAHSRLGVLHVPLTEFLRWNLPTALTSSVLRSGFVLRPSPDPVLDARLFERWARDLGQTPVPTATHVPLEQHRTVLLEVEAFLRRFAGLETGQEAPPTQKLEHLNRAEQLARLIAERHAEPLGAERLAREVGLHPNYAMTLFRDTFGLTLLEHLTQHRVATAQRLLITTRMSVLDIALESGFGSVSRFYSAFGRLSGMSPLAYRQRHGQ